MSLKIYTPFYFFCFTIVLLLSNSLNSNAQTSFALNQNIDNYPSQIQSSKEVDLDQDGNIDVLLGTNKGIFWCKNDSIGNFYCIQIITTDAEITDVNAADIDNDGDVDILFTEHTSGIPLLLSKNDGANNFSEPQNIGINVGLNFDNYFTKNFTIVDLDNDNNMDIVVQGGSVWYKNDGNGNFTVLNNMEGGILSASDFDNDGDNDLIVYSWSNDILAVYKNDGEGNFTIGQTIPIAHRPYLVYAADVDNDGDKDIITASTYTASGTYDQSDMLWYANDGEGNFDFQQIIATNPWAINVMVTDIDNDGDMDILMGSNWFSSPQDFFVGANWFENNGENQFTINNISNDNVAYNSFLTAIADFDNDGNQDVLLTNAYGEKVWRINDGYGNFSESQYITVQRNDSFNTYMVDVNGDGYVDVLSASEKVFWLQNDGTGHFNTFSVINTIRGGNFYVADYDNDGDVDIILIDVYEQTVNLFKNDGNANFSFGQTIFSYVGYVENIVISDFDNDGDTDVVYISAQQQAIMLYLNDGIGNFNTGQIISDNYNYIYNEMVAADLDNDGLMDIVGDGYNNGMSTKTVYWLKNNGANNFTMLNLFTHNSNLSKLHLSDLNNDNNLDILLADNTEDKIVWFKNNNGSFTNSPKIIKDDTHDVYQIITADLDNDGNKDVVWSKGEVLWAKNEGDDNFGTIQTISSNNDVENNLIAYDLNNDGDVDIFQGISNWYENLLYSSTLHGIVYYDLNQDGQYNNGEYLLQNQTVELTPNFITKYTNNNGYFYLLTTENHQVSIYQNSLWHNTSDSLVNFTTSANQDTTINFGLYPNTLTTNIMPYLTSGVDRCNQQIPYYLSINNQGTNIDALSVVKLHPDAQLVYQSATPAPDSISTDGSLYWHIDSLIPTQQSNFVVLFQTPTSDSVGDTLSVLASVKTYNNFNEQVNHNTFTYKHIVNCDQNPNNKQVSPLGVQAPSYTLIDSTKEFVYTIRFQNTSNDTAFRVMISDPLSYYLDWSTFRLINSSHAVQVYCFNGRMMRFIFDNILLPDSTTNQIGSQGFIQYAIKPIIPFYNGMNIENTAYISFDQNAEINTYTVNNRMVFEIPTGINNINAANGFDIIRLTPNPTNSKVQITFVTQQACNTTLELRDLTGRLVLFQKNKANSGTNTATIDLSPFAQGLYVVSLNNGKNIITAKVVKQ